MTTKHQYLQPQYITTSWKFLATFFLMMLKNVKSFSTNAYKSSYNTLSQNSARLIRSCSFACYPKVDGTRLKMGLMRVSSRGEGLGFPSMENLSSLSGISSSLTTQMRVFGSWHQEVDFRATPPVYDDREIIGDYTYTSTEFLPALSDWVVEEYIKPPNTQTSTATSKKFRPFRMVRRVANWAFGVGLNEVEKTSF